MDHKINMKRSDALRWVLMAIRKQRYEVAKEILSDLIKQEEIYEENEKKEGSD